MPYLSTSGTKKWRHNTLLVSLEASPKRLSFGYLVHPAQTCVFSVSLRCLLGVSRVSWVSLEVSCINKNLGLRYDLAELTMANDLILYCNVHPVLCGIFQCCSIHNATSRSTSSLSYRMQHARLPTPLLTHPLCQRPLSHMPIANVAALPTTVPNAHTFDTYSLVVSVPLELLESAAYIFICACTSMLILSKSIYIINAYFIKPMFQLPLSHVLLWSHQFFHFATSAEFHLLPANTGRAVSYPVWNCCPSPRVPAEFIPIPSEIISPASEF